MDEHLLLPTASLILELEREIKDTLDEIEERKAELRMHCLTVKPEGFTIKVPGVGYVEVSSARERRLKGVFPELNVKAFILLPADTQRELITGGLVANVNHFTTSAVPSVKVRSLEQQSKKETSYRPDGACRSV